MLPTGTTNRIILDIEQVPKVVTTNYVICEPICGDCGSTSAPKILAMPGASLGPNMLSAAVLPHHHNMSLGAVRGTLNEVFAQMCAMPPYSTASQPRRAPSGRMQTGSGRACQNHIIST